ncbi:MAG: glutathione S-transferase family protein [Pseudomonadota bacterium]
MADVTIYGFANSTYTRTALMACHEKGVSYDLVSVGGDGEDMKGPTHLARHPFGKIPAMTHGHVTLFESMAIAQYLDDVFDGGVRLQPSDPLERARMTQWATAFQDNIAPVALGEFVLQLIFPSGVDGQPDMARIDAARPIMRSHAEALDTALAGRTFIAGGDAPSIADLLIAPCYYYVGSMPGGMATFEGLDNLGRWWEGVSTRPSFAETIPPIMAQLSQPA